MRELLRRMLSRPIIAIELLVGSLFINILALGSSLYVMQVLNRYVSQGVDATLITLTTGVLMAIALEFAFRQARASLARGVSVGPDEKTAVNGFVTLTRAKVAAIDQIPPETRKEMVSGTAAIETAYNANNITTILDVPFSLVFVFVLYVLQPIIAYIVLGFIIAVFLVGLLGGLAMQAQTAEMQEASGMGSALLGTVTREGDTVRIDAQSKSMDLLISDDEMAARKAAWKPARPERPLAGVMQKYADQVGSAHLGAVTHRGDVYWEMEEVQEPQE